MKRMLLYTAFGLALTAGTARADMITETYTFASLAGYSSEFGTSFPEFNSALGTLNSITLNDAAIATFSGGGANDFNQATYEMFLNGEEFDMAAVTRGNGLAGTVISDFTEIDPAIVSAFVGSGNVGTSVSVLDTRMTPASISSIFGTESLTYNYTPKTTTVPEPGSLALLGAGLFTLGMLHRRRHAA